MTYFQMRFYKIFESVVIFWDVGGAKSIRPYWENYYENTHVLLYFFDASDRKKVDESVEAFSEIFENDHIKENVPVIVVGNKSDLPEFSPDFGKFESNKTGKKIHTLPCSALDLDSVKNVADKIFEYTYPNAI